MALYSRENPDGTSVYQRTEYASLQIADPARVPIQAGEYLDELTAMQFGLWWILDQLEFTSIKRSELMLNGRLEKTQFHLESIYLDHPDTEDTQALQSPSATIMAEGEAELQLAHLMDEQRLLEETANVYGEGTLLQVLYESSVTLTVGCVCTNKDDRAAIRKGVISALAREPLDDRPGRRVIIEPYYGRLATYDLQGVSYLDTKDESQRKRFHILFRVQADIEVVDLVPLPAEFKPRTCVDVSTDALE